MKTIITIQGTHCASCKALIEDVCKEIAGIRSCNVDFKTGSTLIEHEDKVNWEIFKEEIESLGKYKILPSGLTACKECHLVYATAQEAEACGKWCAAHRSCNLEITKNSLTKGH